MRILYALHGYKPAYRVGGPIISVSSLAEKLVSRGHEVTVFTSNSNLDEDLDVPCDQPVEVSGVTVWYFRRDEPLQRWLPFVPYLSKSMGFLYCPKLAGQLERLVPSFDLVHTHMPFVYHQRGVFDPERLKFRSWKKRAYIRFMERPIMQQAATLIALTEAEQGSYRALGIETPCRVIPNGIDISAYPPSTDPELDAWGIPEEAQVILFLSRLHPLKGGGNLVEAFLRIQSTFPNAVLILAGPDEWGYQAKYQGAMAELGLSRRVLFPGMVSGNLKRALLSRANLFCLPSVGEGFSMAVLEALASSTAVLLSSGCHFPDVERANAGRIADPAPGPLADAMAGLLSDIPGLREMGTAGRELVGRCYTWDSVADRMLDAYQEGIHRFAAI